MPLEFNSHQRAFYEFTLDSHTHLVERGCRFAHYTSAATAIQILRNREIWMRSTQVMNDISEVEHGFSSLMAAFETDQGRALLKVLDEFFPGISKKVLAEFVQWEKTHHSSTYITCLSAHALDPAESDDRYGRLSMWRAYGGRECVAFVVRGEILFKQEVDSPLKSIPVAYMEKEGAVNHLKRIRLALRNNSDFVRSLGEAKVLGSFSEMLQLAAVAIKHPVFSEEREWRVVVTGGREVSSGMKKDIEIVGGVPQYVLKISLQDDPDRNLVGLDPDKLIERVLIGPSDYASTIHGTILHAMKEAGIKNAESRIHHTRIPLRQNQR